MKHSMGVTAVLILALVLALALQNHVQAAPYARRVSSAPRAGIVNGNPGVNRLGGDLPGSPMKMPIGSMPRDCAYLCGNTSQCLSWSYYAQNCGNGSAPQCFLKGSVPTLSLDKCATTGVLNAYIEAPVYPFLPAGSVTPLGWMKRQMILQDTGLAGHLQLFWPDVANSSWIGGLNDTYEHNQERMPYWLQGTISMAYMVQDESLISQIVSILDYILKHQLSDGWLGPTYSLPDGYRDPWPRMPVLFALSYYSELNSSDTRVIPAMFKYIRYLQNQLLTDMSLKKYMWTYVRVQDMQMILQWLYDNHGTGNEQMLMDVDELMQQFSFDWKNYFRTEFPKDDVGPHWDYYSHGVNNGMAMKGTAVWYRQSHNTDDRSFNYERVETMDRYHGLASGIFSCDECLAGLNPSRGSETCTVVETMFSYATMFSILGDQSFADRVEQLAFNALPATMDPTMWEHQYLQQTNLVASEHQDDPWWNTDGGDSNIYGLQPNYGCCTVNFPQGFSRFVQNQYMMTQDQSSTGIIAAFFSPSQLNVVVEDPIYGNNSIQIIQETDYPLIANAFINFTIQADYSFPFSFRIPAWGIGAVVTYENGDQDYPAPATIYTYNYKPDVSKGNPNGIQKLWLQLPTEFRVQHRYNDAVAIYYGPLLMGLNFPYDQTITAKYAFQSVDYQILPHDPSSWQYGILIDEQNLGGSLNVTQYPVPKLPFDPLNPSLTVTAYARAIKWGMQHGDADFPPQSPVNSTNPLVPIQLIPFGNSMLRIAEIPYLAN